jgi:glycosyltransferase involved in cell wall biosynthesis
MLVGEGLLFNRLIEYSLNSDVVIIVDSLNSQSSLFEFQKEKETLRTVLKEHSGKQIVYVSSTRVCDPLDQSHPYVIHRKEAEAAVAKCPSYLIVRLPQVLGSSDRKDTLFDHFIQKIVNGETVALHTGAFRYFIDVDDVFFALHSILKEKIIVNATVTLSHPSKIPMERIVPLIEKFLSKKAIVSFQPHRTGDYEIDSTLITLPSLTGLSRDSDTYFERILRKHYSHYLGIKWKISVVVPTFFEEKGIAEFYKRTKSLLQRIRTSYSHEIIFVNDGSTDGTLPQLLSLVAHDPCVKVIDLSRNFGNQPAISAGIEKATGDLVVIIDDDLQDPPEVILNFLAKWHEGYQVVYGIRGKRKGVGPLFRGLASLYYRVLDFVSEVKIPVDTGDFRLIDRDVANVLLKMGEENRYFRGMVAWVGFNQYGWEYVRDSRFAGETKFTFMRYARFAVAGILGFSEKPLYVVSYLGFIVMLFAFAVIGYVFISKLVDPASSIRGWPSLVALISFFSGTQLLSTGIVGLYVGKIYRQARGRPIYVTRKEFGFEAKGAEENDHAR